MVGGWELLMMVVGGEGEVVGAPEQWELDVCNCMDFDAEVVWEEKVMGGWVGWEACNCLEGDWEVDFAVEVVWEEVILWEACMPCCDGLPQLRACSSHREQQRCYAIIENSLPDQPLPTLPRREYVAQIESFIQKHYMRQLLRKSSEMPDGGNITFNFALLEKIHLRAHLYNRPTFLPWFTPRYLNKFWLYNLHTRLITICYDFCSLRDSDPDAISSPRPPCR